MVGHLNCDSARERCGIYGTKGRRLASTELSGVPSRTKTSDVWDFALSTRGWVVKKDIPGVGHGKGPERRSNFRSRACRTLLPVEVGQ